MPIVKAHFDGTVFIPDETVEFPKDVPLRLTVEVDDEAPLTELVRAVERLPDDPDWPADGAAQHDHYLYGTAKCTE